MYTYKVVKQRASDCGDKPDTSCTVAKVTYPFFPDQKVLNDTVVKRLLIAYYTGDKPDSSLQQQTQKFIQFYNYDTTRNADHPNVFYTLESSATVVRQDSSLITLQIDRYTYDGGAHGSDYTGFINWDTGANKKIELGDILSPGNEENLRAIAEKNFRKQEKLSDTGSFTNYSFKGRKFALNNNFLVTPIGISFLYNEYEIKPYSEGQTTLLIPYMQIKSLLRTNTVISQYIR
ncbi:DUF3298 and DUF4163 domain-containing protein [Mucilaginibacter ginsenosidivorans]|uniref:DUF3298 and DUF4163 domain-containing protein n=1 Tax=Mucilaginibacter ginsenosidivorans TaxID=398053 RepID=UPI001652A5AF|nr:DUF3298 and DUF4163 domain-containing protein [Mucilaginibacter ginsenosidivorans]